MNRADVIASLASAGLFHGHWEIDDEVYEPVSRAFIQQAWSAWVDSLPAVLRELRDVGGGKTLTFPRYIAEVFDCDNLAQSFATFLDTCMAVDAATNSRPRGNTAAGCFNFLRNGDAATGHCRNWWVDYDGTADVFDAGDGSFPALAPIELPTIFFGESV